MLALSAYTFTSLMLAENESAMLHGRQLQARQTVDSGVSHVQYFLEQDEVSRQNFGGVYYNTEMFQAQLVVDHEHPRGRSRFAVLAPELDNDGIWGGMRFGLEDESARLNINALDLEVPDFFEDMSEDISSDAGSSAAAGAALGGGPSSNSPGRLGEGRGFATGAAGGNDEGDDEELEEEGEEETDTSGRALLMKLPGMTLDIADAILDWIDEDDIEREYGAEISYYSGLDPPYSPKNGPLETVEELLLVRGVTPDLLFGRDINRNGLIDMQEQQLPLIVDYDDTDGSLDRGWSSYLTLYSMEKNVSSLGLPRIDLNGEDMQVLFDELSAVVDTSWATFIVAYRQNGPYRSNNDDDDDDEDEGEGETEPAGNQKLDLTQPGRVPLTQVLDLIGAKTRVTIEGQEEPVIIESPFSDEIGMMSSYLPQLMDNCTINPDPVIPGRVNINRAPRAVLMAIPGMTENIADLIISQRDLENSEYDVELQHETWLLSRGIVTLEEMRAMMPYVTGGGDVYRAQIVGYFDEGEIAARCEVIIDATSAAPRVLFWRDISHLGRGFPLELLGIDLSKPDDLTN
jgi:DNA uptake protein ComE-like DNA-binding protein